MDFQRSFENLSQITIEIINTRILIIWKRENKGKDSTLYIYIITRTVKGLELK